jgi:hypothetical protein
MSRVVDRGAERTELLAALSLVTIATAVLIFVHCDARPRVGPPILAVVGAAWLAFSLFLRVRRDDFGREGRYVDLWSVSHLLGGALLAMLGIPLGWSVALAVGWEAVEVVARVHEYPVNRLLDVVLATAGWVGFAACAG